MLCIKCFRDMQVWVISPRNIYSCQKVSLIIWSSLYFILFYFCAPQRKSNSLHWYWNSICARVRDVGPGCAGKGVLFNCMNHIQDKNVFHKAIRRHWWGFVTACYHVYNSPKTITNEMFLLGLIFIIPVHLISCPFVGCEGAADVDQRGNRFVKSNDRRSASECGRRGECHLFSF